MPFERYVDLMCQEARAEARRRQGEPSRAAGQPDRAAAGAARTERPRCRRARGGADVPEQYTPLAAPPHAHATHALEHGHAPIHLVQATLGHASVATTSKYLHARPTDNSARYLGV